MPYPVRTDKVVSHYEVGEMLGAGGMGEVYRATDMKLGRKVALKFLEPQSDVEARERFLKEAQAASSLDHPNICTIFEVNETDQGDIFIAMAFYEGETLDRILSRGALSLNRALMIAAQAGRGLAAAHEELIVHRDIKPQNLMIARNDTVKILDFGLALLLGERRFTESGTVLGTPAYMSPEQLRGEPVDHRTDIWSLGVVLYEMIAGRTPFKADRLEYLIQSILHETPQRLSSLNPEIPNRMDRILSRALAKHPKHRYEQIDTMVQDILEAQSIQDSKAITIRLRSTAIKSSVAVLPFEDMSSAADQGFLCDGIAEEILRALSRIPDLYVASRTSSFQFKHRATDIREIGARLNVDTILEGSVRRVGDRVRISAQLVSVDNGYRLWYERYDRNMQDIFSIEDEIADQISRALQVTLLEKIERPEEGLLSTDAEAYELYLQGREFFHQHRRKSFEIALQTFSRVIEIDPRYARAYAGIADCHSFLQLYFGRGQEAIAAADEASAKALELAPELPEAHTSRGLALFLQRKFEEAEHHLQRAIELDPRLYTPHYIFGRVCFSEGRMSEAATHFREGCSLVPEAYDSWYLLGMCYRKMDLAAQARNADLECIEAVKKRVRSHPEDTRAWTMGASVLVELGEPERASEWVGRALAIDPDEAIIIYNAACVYTALKKFDEAIACLETSVGMAGISKDWVKNDPDLDALREDPRFQKLLKRVYG